MTAPITLPASIATGPERSALIEELVDRAEGIPGVTGATASSNLPMSIVAVTDVFTIDGRPLPKGEARPRAIVMSTTPDFLDAIGIELLRGRYLDGTDRDDSRPVAVIHVPMALRAARMDPMQVFRHE